MSTWEHLETIALDIETDLLERNLLIAFCTPQTEKAVDQEVGYGGLPLVVATRVKCCTAGKEQAALKLLVATTDKPRGCL